MLVTILKNLSGLGKSFQDRQVVDLPDDVASEWCRIGYASPALPAATEKASSKVIPEVRKNGNQGSNAGSDTTDNRTSDTVRTKKPSKD
jgi:hypothetical protein